MGYTSELNAQILISLLKSHGVKKIVASPGATNVSFVASVQQDSFFEIYSSVDERSAAYIACGLAEESGETVVLSCTGATASRNYYPGLTEAYYRKLPILTVTSTMPEGKVGNNFPQVIDRSVVANDVAKLSVHIPMIKDKDDEWMCINRINEAILELRHNWCGPVHINLETKQSGDFDVKELPSVRVINRITRDDAFPQLNSENIGILVGTHSKWSESLTEEVDAFCEKYGAVVIGDHTSNYCGKYSVPASLVANQKFKKSGIEHFDVLIHIGNISGAYLGVSADSVWRVNPDGKVCDTLKALKNVFEMSEEAFFKKYNECDKNSESRIELWEAEYKRLSEKIPELPFSNLWIAQQLSKNIPSGSILHLGILNSFRSWSFFEIPENVRAYSNTGGFGIDGCLSTVLGTALATDKTVFAVLGDLAFFYDMNALGNRHITNNIRILVINNGRGQEFRNFNHKAAQFGDDTDTYIAAAGHYGNQSPVLIKNYVEALGFTYICADNKEDFMNNKDAFLNCNSDAPIVFEIFTKTEDESDALKMITTLDKPASEGAKSAVKNILGDKGVKTLKKILKG